MLMNVGAMDRVLRVVLGAALVAATAFGFVGGWGWLGLLPLISGMVGVCPAYLPLGLDTCGRKRPD
jgi:hypothetical protein